MNGPQLVRVRDRVADQLVLRGAVSPASATAWQPKGPFERRLLARHRKTGAIVEVAPGRYYLDVPTYHERVFRWERRAVPIGIGAIVIASLLMLLFV